MVTIVLFCLSFCLRQENSIVVFIRKKDPKPPPPPRNVIHYDCVVLCTWCTNASPLFYQLLTTVVIVQIVCSLPERNDSNCILILMLFFLEARIWYIWGSMIISIGPSPMCVWDALSGCCLDAMPYTHIGSTA